MHPTSLRKCYSFFSFFFYFYFFFFFFFIFFFFFFFLFRTSYIVTCTRCNTYIYNISYHNIHLYFSLGLYFPIHLLLLTYCIAILGSRRCLRTDLVLAAMWYALPVPGYSLPGTTEYVCLFVLVFTLFCSFLKQGNPRVKGGKALGCIYKGLWTLGVEKGSAVHRREELGSRTDTTYLRFVFFTYCGTSIGYWLPFTSALAPRCSYEGWAVLSGGHFRTPC